MCKGPEAGEMEREREKASKPRIQSGKKSSIR